MKHEAAARREEVARLEQEAEANRNAPVDDSKIVEQMFGFLPEGEQVQTADDSKYAVSQSDTRVNINTWVANLLSEYIKRNFQILTLSCCNYGIPVLKRRKNIFSTTL